MDILKVNRSKDAVKDGGSGSAYMNKTGVYDATIKFASIDVSKNNAKSVNFNFDHNGQPETIYGPYITDKAGNPLEIGLSLVRDKLGVIAGVDGNLNIEEETHNVGKDNKPQEFAVITDFTDLPVKVRIQMEYSIYNGEIRSRKVIKNFFRADGASAEEILAIEAGESAEIGKRLAYESEKFTSDSYKDGLTEADITAWLDDKRANKATSAAPKVNTSAASTKLFGKK